MEGFTLIDVLIGAALAIIIFVGLFGAYQLGFRVVRQAQRRVVASNISNEKMEMVRSLDYESLGTVGASLPFAEGVLNSSEVVQRGSVDYAVETQVKYIVDSLDGAGEPEDACPYDYKRTQIKVSWEGIFGGSTTFITDISPSNLTEECLETGGILKVSVIDAYGSLVNSPLVEILDPSTVIDSATPDSGEHYFPLAEGDYRVRVSKSGYNSGRTYSLSEVITPENPDLEIVNGSVVPFTLSIDKLSNMTINSVTTVQTDDGESTVSVSDVSFLLTGDKIIGRDEDDNSVPKYEESLNTGASGSLSLTDMEWDNYNFEVDSFVLDHTDPVQPVELAPDTSISVDLYVATDYSLSVSVKDSETGEPVFSAETRLFKTGYDKTEFTDEDGSCFFVPLEGGSYNLEVSAPGFNSYSGTVDIAGNNTSNVLLERVE